jgi:hypothetical protein
MPTRIEAEIREIIKKGFIIATAQPRQFYPIIPPK